MELKKTDQFQKIKLKIRNTEKFEIEIGCGNGHFITEYAKRQDSSFLIGVELKKGRYLKALAKVEKRALKNTCVIHNRA